MDEDAQLMLALQRGEDGAFDALFDRWATRLIRFLGRMVNDRAVAEELVQETFLRVYRSRERYAPDARFSTWLFTIAANAARNELRRPYRRHAHQSVHAPVGSGRAEDGPRLELVGDTRPADTIVETKRLGAAVESALGRTAGTSARRTLALRGRGSFACQSRRSVGHECEEREVPGPPRQNPPGRRAGRATPGRPERTGTHRAPPARKKTVNPELEERLSALLDGALSAQEEAGLRAELERSPALRERLAALAAVDEALRALPDPEAGSALKERVRARIADESAPPVPRRERRTAPFRTRRRYLIAAAIAAGLSVLILVGNPEDTSDAPDLPGARLAAADPEGPDDSASVPVVPQRTGEDVAAEEPAADGWMPDDFLVPTEIAEADAGSGAVAEGDLEIAEGDLEIAEGDLHVVGVLELLAALDELEGASG